MFFLLLSPLTLCFIPKPYVFHISFFRSSSRDVKEDVHHARFSAAEDATAQSALRLLGRGEALCPPSDQETAPLHPPLAEGRPTYRLGSSAPLSLHGIRGLWAEKQSSARLPPPQATSYSPKIHASFRPEYIVPRHHENTPSPSFREGNAFPPQKLGRLLPPNIWVDMGLLGGVSASFFIHGAVFVLLFAHFAQKKIGSPKDLQDTPQLEMIFAPPALNQMKGERVKEQGGGGTPPPPTAAPAPNPAPAKTPPAPTAPPETLSETGEIAAPNPTQKEQAQKPSPPKPQTQANASAEKTSHSKSANNPFAHLTDISFDGDPTTKRHTKGKKGGNRGGAVDMTMGPLSLNGKINAPYTSSSTIKGVSSDYGAELDAWIRNHIFYPDDAVRQELEGASAVHVRLDRKGHVQQVYLRNSSGVSSLDMATVSIFKDQKLPDVPEDMKGDHFDIDVQVNYVLIRQ